METINYITLSIVHCYFTEYLVYKVNVTTYIVSFMQLFFMFLLAYIKDFGTFWQFKHWMNMLHPRIVLISLCHTLAHYCTIAAMRPIFVNSVYTHCLLMMLEPIYSIALDMIFYKKILTVKRFVSILTLLFGAILLYPMSFMPGDDIDIFMFSRQIFYCNVSNAMSALGCLMFKHHLSVSPSSSVNPTMLYSNVVYVSMILSAVNLIMWRLPSDNLDIFSEIKFWEGMWMMNIKGIVILILSSIASEMASRSRYKMMYNYPGTWVCLMGMMHCSIKLIVNCYILKAGSEITSEHAYGIGLITIGVGLYVA